MEIIEELKELNLDENEIKVYIACLALGSAKVNDISLKADLIRTTTYGVLKSLMEKGFVSNILKDNVNFYMALNPNQLLQILEDKKTRLSTVIPKLEEIQKFIPNNFKVEVFEGKEGLKTIFNEFVSEPNLTVKIIGFYSKWIDYFDFWTNIYYRKKKENNAKSLVIVDDSERKHTKDKRIINSRIRYIRNLDPNSQVFIYKNKGSVNN